jgi:hypothetical protein
LIDVTDATRASFAWGVVFLLDILRRVTNPAVLCRCLPFRKCGPTWKFALRF